jgi:8-oxo-dGTP pyrophosphatase MutT (NUDIX family)
VIAVPRAAATVVLMRDRPGAPPQVLMVRRHGGDSFAADAYVFPGGVLEAEDRSTEALALTAALAPDATSRLNLEAEPQLALAFHLAAIRETFEEVGILLARPAAGAAFPDAAELRSVRGAMQKGRAPFWAWLRERGLRPAVEDLTYFAHWITPAARPKRFDTRFFLAAAGDEANPEPDREEIVECLWISPAEAVAAERDGRMHMINATVKNLELLSGFSRAAEAVEVLRRRDVPTILPKLVPQGDGYRIVHPWEPGYDLV